MCGRSSLTKTEKDIESRFNATFYTEELERYNPLPNFNVAPTQMMPVITGEDQQHIHIFRWGLIPFWAKDKSIGAKMINARKESLHDKPAFKSLLSSKRCLVPMDGFYEWKTREKSKIPYRILTTDQEIFAVAGLWDVWKASDTGALIHSFTIITTESNTLMKTIHDRMPAILLKSNEKFWMDSGVRSSEALELIFPYPSEMMEMYEVSDKVNNVKSNDATLLDRVANSQQVTLPKLF